MRISKTGRWMLSAFCGFSVAAIPFAVDRVSWLKSFGDLADFIWLPGAFLASPVFPEGAHTGMGAPNYAYIVGLLNLMLYGGVAYLGLGFLFKQK